MKYYLRGQSGDNIALYNFDDETGTLTQMQDGMDLLKDMEWDVEHVYNGHDNFAWWAEYNWEILLPQFVFIEML